jgi:hypothetical protein
MLRIAARTMQALQQQRGPPSFETPASQAPQDEGLTFADVSLEHRIHIVHSR